MNFGDDVLKFYRKLRIKDPLPEGIETMNPYRNASAFEACEAFYKKFYDDGMKRHLILGINPGRHGAGITGIPFTDPIKLEARFGIPTNLPKKPELSADFVHLVIDAFGGPEKFFRKFFINSVSPLGFVQSGKNINYYDSPALKNALAPFIKASMHALLKLSIDREVAFCLGEGANYKYLLALNCEMQFFERIIPLAHPRFIMQYRRKQIGTYVEDYLLKLNSVASET